MPASGSRGTESALPTIVTRLEGSLWSEPQLGKERVPECAKSLTTGPRHEVLETPGSKHLLRAEEGPDPEGSLCVRTWALSVLPWGPCARQGGVQATGAAALFVPLCLMQSAQGSLGGLLDVLLVLPKRQNVPGRGHAGPACRCRTPGSPGVQGLLKLVQPLRVLPQLQ